jgi:hypothetical protein
MPRFVYPAAAVLTLAVLIHRARPTLPAALAPDAQ